MLIKHILFQLFLLEEMWPAENQSLHILLWKKKKAAGNIKSHTFAFNTAWELKPIMWTWHLLMVCSETLRLCFNRKQHSELTPQPWHSHCSPGRAEWGGHACWGSPDKGLLSQGSLSCCTVSRLKNTETNSLEFSLWGGKQIMLTTCKHCITPWFASLTFQKIAF